MAAGTAVVNSMDAQHELQRRELQLMLEIATHELECLTEDGADANAIDAKMAEIDNILERQNPRAAIDARLAEIRARLVDIRARASTGRW